MNIDWDEFQKQIREMRMGEKVSADINTKYASLMIDLTKEKYSEWREKLGPVVRDIIDSKKEDPEAAAESMILVILQIVRHLAEHEVLFEYGNKVNAELIRILRALDERTALLVQVLSARGVLTEDDLRSKADNL